MDHEDRLSAMYRAFNARDLDLVPEFLAPDVDWPNAWEGGRVHGHDAVRAYWTRQWAAIDPTVEPVGFEARSDGRVAVDVHQVVRTRDGTVVTDGRVVHVYTFREGLVTRMDVEEA
jgi:ketosteroid isomerase-like protein